MGDRVTGVAGLGRAVAESLEEVRVAQNGGARVRERLLARAVPRVRASARPWRIRRSVVAGAASVLAVAAALLVVFGRGVGRPHESAPLTFVVGGVAENHERGVVGAFIAAPPSADLPLAFSDGSSVRLAPTARARVASLDPAGAKVLIESGTLSVHVVHADKTRWEIAAGPFAVHVTGTTFDVAWDPVSEGLVVKLTEGSVIVTGCAIEGGRRVGAGDELRTSCKKKTAESDPTETKARTSQDEKLADSSAELPEKNDRLEPSDKTDDNKSDKLETGAPEAARPETHADKRIKPAALERDEEITVIVSLAKRGAHMDAISAAEGRGFAKTCDALSASELLVLADAGRYAGRFDRANEALTSVRTRFGGSEAAASAAFELGRIAFDAKREFGVAGDYFDVYLSERPTGSLAREALGRGLEARSRSGDTTRAQALATRYLAAYPDGPHAQLARRITGAVKAEADQ